LVAGYNLNENSKLEVSFQSFKLDYDHSNNIDGNQFGIDYLYMLNEVSQLKPYLGVGISTNSLDYKIENSDTVDGLGFKLRVGTYYALTTNEIRESSSNFYGLGLNANYKF